MRENLVRRGLIDDSHRLTPAGSAASARLVAELRRARAGDRDEAGR